MSDSSRRQVAVAGIVLVIVGGATFLAALSGATAQRAWEAFLVNLLFWTGLAQGGIIVSAALYLTQARWGGASAYRLAEAFVGFLPVGFLLFWALYPGRELIFPWIRHPIPQKAAWLNAPFLFERDGVGLLVMTLLSLWFVRCSRRTGAVEWAEDSTITLPPRALRWLSPTLAILYFVVYSLIAFDLIMSLSPVWYSTLFGAYFLGGAFWSALCAMAVLASIGFRPLPRGVSLEHSTSLHDIGKLVFAFSIFWVYLMWSQFLPIWYAAIPEETFFVVLRVYHLPWGIPTWTALLLVWLLPFTVLLGKYGKRTPAIIGTVCTLGLIGMWIERYILVTPSLSPNVLPFGWVELLITAGFLGAFALCTLPGMRLVPATSAHGVHR